MLLTVILSLVMQVLLYWLFRRKRYAGLLIFLLFLFLNFFLFPILWVESVPLNRDNVNCGMFAIGFFVFFWMVGGPSVLLAHFIRWLLLRLRRRQRAVDNPYGETTE